MRPADPAALPWVLSARTPRALRARAADLGTLADGAGAPGEVELAAALVRSRSAFAAPGRRGRRGTGPSCGPGSRPSRPATWSRTGW